MPATAEQISSPYDPEARYGKKRDISWTGYKAHLTETCDPETPHVITNVETTLATTPDDHMLTVVHQSLAKNELLPSEHLVDMGYTGCRMLVESQQRHGVVVVGPVVEDTSWQAHAAEGFSKADFHVDWDQQVVTCPEGKQSISWLPSTYQGRHAIRGPLRAKRLRRLPDAKPLHSVEGRAAYHHAAGA
jgi:transposase